MLPLSSRGRSTEKIAAPLIKAAARPAIYCGETEKCRFDRKKKLRVVPLTIKLLWVLPLRHFGGCYDDYIISGVKSKTLSLLLHIIFSNLKLFFLNILYLSIFKNWLFIQKICLGK